MFDVSTTVRVKDIEPNRRILVEWNEPPTQVEWTFTPQADDTTVVTITETGFHGDADQRTAHAIDSMGGFTMVLCALKALVEHDFVLPVVLDSHPNR
jgi:uncharacterized protein YndB with AHSA1/START domain